jgi:hypothetical protein
MIARKSMLNESKLSSGASLVSTTPWRYTESSKMTAKTSIVPGYQSLNRYSTIQIVINSFGTQVQLQVRGAPVRLPVKKWPWVATSPVALQNTPKKTTRSKSTRHSRIICCESLEEKISILRPHRSTAQIPLKAGLIFSSFSVLFLDQLIKNPQFKALTLRANN